MAEQTEIESREGEAFNASGLVGKVAAALEAGAPDVARALVADLRPRDLADVIALLAPAERVALIQAMGPAFDYEVFS
jgi:magnesium transporter